MCILISLCKPVNCWTFAILKHHVTLQQISGQQASGSTLGLCWGFLVALIPKDELQSCMRSCTRSAYHARHPIIEVQCIRPKKKKKERKCCVNLMFFSFLWHEALRELSMNNTEVEQSPWMDCHNQSKFHRCVFLPFHSSLAAYSLPFSTFPSISCRGWSALFSTAYLRKRIPPRDTLCCVLLCSHFQS